MHKRAIPNWHCCKSLNELILWADNFDIITLSSKMHNEWVVSFYSLRKENTFCSGVKRLLGIWVMSNIINSKQPTPHVLMQHLMPHVDHINTHFHWPLICIYNNDTKSPSFHSDSPCPNRNKVVHYKKDLGIIGGCLPLALILEKCSHLGNKHLLANRESAEENYVHQLYKVFYMKYPCSGKMKDVV